MSVSWAEVEFILSPPKARSPCLQRACKVRDMHVRCRASMRRLRPLRHAYGGGTGHARWRHGYWGPGWHWICICRPPKPYRQSTSEVHRRSITAACSLCAPASLKTRTGDVHRRYGSLLFGHGIRRRPATERYTAGCDRGFRQPTTFLHTWSITWDIKGCLCLFKHHSPKHTLDW